eukprot:1246936-Rhodomonas_salina.2
MADPDAVEQDDDEEIDEDKGSDERPGEEEQRSEQAILLPHGVKVVWSSQRPERVDQLIDTASVRVSTETAIAQGCQNRSSAGLASGAVCAHRVDEDRDQARHVWDEGEMLERSDPDQHAVDRQTIPPPACCMSHRDVQSVAMRRAALRTKQDQGAGG